MTRKLLLPILVVCLWMTGREAFASPVFYTFEGVIGLTTIPGVPLGTSVTGTAVYDPDAPPDVVIPGFRTFEPTVASISATIGADPVVSGPIMESIDAAVLLTLGVVPDGLYDVFGLFGARLSLAFLDADATFFASHPGLPATIPLADFEYAILTFIPDLSPSGADLVPFAHALVRVSPAPVPEPATLLLFGVAAAAVGARRLRASASPRS